MGERKFESMCYARHPGKSNSISTPKVLGRYEFENLGGMPTHAEFAYNRVVNSTTSYSPFEWFKILIHCPLLICYLSLTLFL